MAPVLRFSPASDQVRISLVKISPQGTFSPGGEWFPCVFPRDKIFPRVFPREKKSSPVRKKAPWGEKKFPGENIFPCNFPREKNSPPREKLPGENLPRILELGLNSLIYH